MVVKVAFQSLNNQSMWIMVNKIGDQSVNERHTNAGNFVSVTTTTLTNGDCVNTIINDVQGSIYLNEQRILRFNNSSLNLMKLFFDSYIERRTKKYVER